MKKMYLLLLFIGMFVILPNSVMAATDVKFTCTNEAMVGNKIECEIALASSGESIKGVQANFKFGEAFSYVKVTVSSGWKIASSNNEGLIAVNVDGVNKDSLVAKIEFLVSGKAIPGDKYEIKLNNIQLSNGEKDISIADKSATVNILSILDILDTLNVNDTSLELKDGITTYAYQLGEKDTSVEISASLGREGYTFDEDYGPRVIGNLKDGENQAFIKVMKEDQEVVTLTINLNRKKKNESGGNISSNPKTGNLSFLIIVTIFIVSFILFLYYSKKKNMWRLG